MASKNFTPKLKKLSQIITTFEDNKEALKTNLDCHFFDVKSGAISKEGEGTLKMVGSCRLNLDDTCANFKVDLPTVELTPDSQWSECKQDPDVSSESNLRKIRERVWKALALKREREEMVRVEERLLDIEN